MIAVAVSPAQRAADLVEDAAEMPVADRWRFIFATFATSTDDECAAIVEAVIEAEERKARAVAVPA